MAADFIILVNSAVEVFLKAFSAAKYMLILNLIP